MGTEMKVEIIQRQIIKPSSPTPHDLTSFKLSIFDQMAFAIYIPLLLFYPITSTSKLMNRHQAMFNERCEHLTQSLAKTLTHFYPLAGTIKGNAVVDCNDDGAEFIQAQVNCSLSEILEHPDAHILNRFLPIEIESKEASTGPLLLVQVNMFECGGMAIGLNLSHKIADASTVCTFINCWSQTALHSSEVTLPEFGAASLFPPIDFSNSQPPAREVVKAERCITRRFVFDASKIAALQSEVASSAVPKPTRVEAVSALIWKCAVEASSRSSNLQLGSPLRPSLFCVAVNLRKRVVPPLPQNFAGNVVGNFTSKTEESVVDLKDLVSKLRKGIEQVQENYAIPSDSNEAWQGIEEKQRKKKTDDIENYSCTSWCRLPYYEADFGWGKPSWVSIASIAIKNLIVLMDKRDCNQIEAWLTLSAESMALFETNTQLLAYASLNPSVNY